MFRYSRRMCLASALLTLVLVPLASPTSAVAGKPAVAILDSSCNKAVHHFDFGGFTQTIFCVKNLASTSQTLHTSFDGDGAFSFGGSDVGHGCNNVFVGPGNHCMDTVFFNQFSPSGTHRTTYIATTDLGAGSSKKAGLVARN